MDAVRDAAVSLGRLIASSDAFVRLRAAESAVRADQATGDLIEALEGQRRKIAELEEQRKPVEVSDKHEMKRLNEQAQGNELLQDLLRAQADYVAMMNRVNGAIREAMESGSEQEGAGAR